MRHMSMILLACSLAVPEARDPCGIEPEPEPTGGGDPAPTVADPVVGEQVFYRVGGTVDAPELRPATVVKTFGGEYANLQVLVDGSNDARYCWPDPDGNPGTSPIFDAEDCRRGLAWKTSAHPGIGIGCWRRA